MGRRRAITLAGVMAATAVAALAAIFTNFGILGATEADDGVGRLNAGTISSESPVPPTTTTSQPDVEIVYEDVFDDSAARGTDDVDDDADGDDADDSDEPATTDVSVPSDDDGIDDDDGAEVDDDGAEVDDDGPEVDEDGPEVDEDGPEVDDHGEYDDD